MKVHSATCSCSVEPYKLWYTLADFLPNWGISRGFLYVCIIYIAGRIRAAVRAGDINFLVSLVQWEITRGAHTVIFRLRGCGGWGEGLGILYIKASVVQWKDICPWQLDLFLKISRGFLCIFRRRISETAMGGPRSSFR
jgi:hypothetical protein